MLCYSRCKSDMRSRSKALINLCPCSSACQPSGWFPTRTSKFRDRLGYWSPLLTFLSFLWLSTTIPWSLVSTQARWTFSPRTTSISTNSSMNLCPTSARTGSLSTRKMKNQLSLSASSDEPNNSNLLNPKRFWLWTFLLSNNGSKLASKILRST
jgi:hypothetical protein